MVYVSVRAGIGKNQCEDSVLVGKTLVNDGAIELPVPTNGIICVADGVGGNAGGYIASSYVGEQLKTFVTLGPVINISTVHQRLGEINASLIRYGQQADLSTLATTLTGLIFTNEYRYLIHIGNTRAYVLQGQYLKQLTTDHTVYNQLLRTGRICEASQCRKNEITNCFGGGNAALFDSLNISEVQDFNTIILTSDGIHDFIRIDELESLLSVNTSGLDICNNILQAAIRAGSKDDMAVVIIRNGGIVDGI